MSQPVPLSPLEVVKLLDLPLRMVSVRLGITENWLRRLARDPRHARRIRHAALQAALEQEEVALAVEHLLAEVAHEPEIDR
jgi:hypothetical protein